MSDFTTVIPVDIEAVKKLLPADSDILGIEWIKASNSVELKWGNRNLVTPFSFALEFPLEQLKSGKVPFGVKNRGEISVAPEPAKKAKKAK